MDMTILSKKQIDEMVKVMDTILSPAGKSVGDIKKKYNLTSDGENIH